MPARDSGDLDTSALTPDGLAELLPASGSALYQRGMLLAEFVVDEDDAPSQLREWLTVVSPIGVDAVIDYVMLDNPIPSMYTAHVASGAIQDHASAHYRAFDTVEFCFDQRDPCKPSLVGRPVRAVSNEHVLLLFWREMWAYPEIPEPRSNDFGPAYYQFPGRLGPPQDLSDALARGVPEEQAKFTVEWGSAGPTAFDAAAKLFDKDPQIGPSAVGEALLASAIEQMQTAVTEGLVVAHDQWEADLLASLQHNRTVEIFDYAPRLAVLSGIAGLVRSAADAASEPIDHAERYWFANTADSARINDGLPTIDQAFDRFSERLRTSLALSATVASSRTLALQQRANEQTAQFQTAITALGSLVLVPTLVVGFFGANVPLPFGNSWLGFALMVWLTVISAALVWRWLNSLRPNTDRNSDLKVLVSDDD